MSAAIVTVKVGGIAGQHAASLAALAREAPPDTVVVHGGGAEIAEWSRRLGIEPRTNADGLRITDADTLQVVVAVLAGLVNTRLVAALSAAGRAAVGLTGADGALLGVRRRDAALGAVGEVTGVDTSLLDAIVHAGSVPVVAPIGRCDEDLLNVNADEAAGAIGAARGGLLLLCTDVPGVIRDGQTLQTMDAAAARAMLDDGSASAGMRPKLRAAIDAACAGCDVRIIDGRSASAVQAALRGEPVGTAVTAR